jgi:hypothetical protein
MNPALLLSGLSPAILADIGSYLPKNTVRTDSRLGGEMRFDADPVANATLFLTRQLEYVRSKTYDVKYAPLKVLEYVPLATDIPVDVDSYVYFVYDSTGQAIIVNPDTKQLPRVETNAKELGGRVVSLGTSYGWTLTELRQAARLNVPLTEKKAQAARRAMNTSIDELVCFGKRLTSPQGGAQTSEIGGFLNSSLISPATTANWLSTTVVVDPVVIATYINAAAQYVHTNTKQIWSVDTMLLSPQVYGKVSTTPMVLGSTALNVTILQYILENSPYIRNVEQWWRLAGTDVSSGLGEYTSASSRCLLYKRDPEVLEAAVPIDFEQMPAQQEALNFEVACHARCGGTKVYQPGAVFYFDVPNTTTS